MHAGPLTQMPQGQEPEQCLAFSLAGQPHAVPILSVQEIRRFSAPTPLPSAPPYVLGLINLRGTVVPVFDLRMRFGMASHTYDRLTVIVVVMVSGRHVGIVADDVSRVISIDRAELRSSPELASHIDMTFVLGLLRDGEDLVTLVDVEKLLGPDLGGLE